MFLFCCVEIVNSDKIGVCIAHNAYHTFKRPKYIILSLEDSKTPISDDDFLTYNILIYQKLQRKTNAFFSITRFWFVYVCCVCVCKFIILPARVCRFRLFLESCNWFYDDCCECFAGIHWSMWNTIFRCTKCNVNYLKHPELIWI